MSLTDKAKDKAKKNPTWLLGLLLIVHLFVISMNRVPNQPSLRYLQLVTMSGLMPFQWLASSSVGAVKNVWFSYVDLRKARIENEELKITRDRLEKEANELRLKVTISEQLNEFEKAAITYEGEIARVIGHDANQWFNTIYIDRGSLAGIEKDQPVVTADGLVGRVITTSSLASQVLLVTDERHGAGAVIAQTETTRWLGILEGKSQYLCDMRFIVPPEKLENGEQVVTSGQDGLYPPGLVIGRVKINGSAAAPVLVEIEPAAKLAKLEMVKVLKVPPEKIRGPAEELKKEEQSKTADRKK